MSGTTRRPSPTVSKSPMASRPAWSTFVKNQRAASPTTSQRMGHRPASPAHAITQRSQTPLAASTLPIRRPLTAAQRPLSPRSASIFMSVAEGNQSHDATPQMELFTQLQDVVVRLSQSAVSEKSKLAHMEKQLQAYEKLVKEQDRMIEELRGFNSKLQKEKDAMVAFRRAEGNSDGGATPINLSARGSRGYSPPGGHDEAAYLLSSVTPKSKSFVQSLVDQLREEKKLRLQVEEQSSKMIGEQQLMIHRLEDRVSKQVQQSQTQSTAMSPLAALRSPRQPRLAHHAGGGPSLRQEMEAVGDLSVPLGKLSLASLANPDDLSDRSDEASRFLAVNLQSEQIDSRSTSASTGITMENASLLLQQIKARHGL